MVESLVRWTKKEEGRAKRYLVSEQTLAWEIYDLFGFGALSSEIVEYLIGLLKKVEPDWEELFKRLERFYLEWCDGRFIDATAETLPQRKARQLQQNQVDSKQRQVDIFAGLNVLILLLEIHRHAQTVDALKTAIYFYPCGQFGAVDSDGTRLLRMIRYSDSLQLGTFGQIVGHFLSSAYLSGADLSDATLDAAVLDGTDLRNAVLENAFAFNTKFNNVQIAGADFTNVPFRGDVLKTLCASASGSNPVTGRDTRDTLECG
jgi:hypothetical protein